MMKCNHTLGPLLSSERFYTRTHRTVYALWTTVTYELCKLLNTDDSWVSTALHNSQSGHLLRRELRQRASQHIQRFWKKIRILRSALILGFNGAWNPKRVQIPFTSRRKTQNTPVRAIKYIISILNRPFQGRFTVMFWATCRQVQGFV
jgi:hypothetical protein